MSDGHLSLYFTLKEGEKADLEVVAAAAIQWVEALRAAAREIVPEAQIKVELVDAQESSLRFNTVLDWAEEQLARIEEGTGKHRRLAKLAIALAVFVPVTGYPTYEFYFGDQPTLSLSEEDRLRIDGFLERTRNLPEVEEKRRKMFRTLERDPSISGVGVAEGRKDPPAVLVPSKEFAERGGLWAIQDDVVDKRTLWPVLDVALIGPVLLNKPRAWTFQPEGLPEFKAMMKDKRFLAALDESHVREQLRTGIPMTIRLKVDEIKENGVWTVKRGGRSVVEVISPRID
ncbi:hypothetical protein LB521_22960 [Mesorhizobium sp. BR-1-1-8]|uniref:hypothetical protein n=1 Tax=Mesorhizobium sp. BR-1-1-8 TaxID=2876659 RepID=UPI001CCFE081|nr:hypothetical protein [Mesorhizobium sp. BR-1-1-8]MBZ9983999.1 hypothetical protein [Mesorhizobium sp. BR-1-1-8]